MREIDPLPLEFEDLRHARGEVELQPDREGQERVFQAFRVGMVEVGVEARQLVFTDETGALCPGVLCDVPTRVRAVGPKPPQLGQVEHLA